MLMATTVIQRAWTVTSLPPRLVRLLARLNAKNKKKATVINNNNNKASCLIIINKRGLVSVSFLGEK